jgi:hypothetical protein
MENRIEEQMHLFACRLPAEQMKANRLRLCFSAPACALAEALRRLALKGAAWAQAQVDAIRLKLLKVGAVVRLGARRVWLQMSSACPWKEVYERAWAALRCRQAAHPPRQLRIQPEVATAWPSRARIAGGISPQSSLRSSRINRGWRAI